MSGDKLRKRVRDAIIQSLAAGVVPRVGQNHIQVGRAAEVKALLGDIRRIADGGATVRFIIGEYGSGKTFFLNLVRAMAHRERLVTAHADLSPDRRFHASGGQARSLYQEAMRNLSTRSKPDGGALPSVLQKFVSEALAEARASDKDVESVIRQRMESLNELVGGYDFAEVVAAYWRGHDTADDNLKTNAVRWMRGEFSTKTDARRALGVRTVVDDNNVYDMLKLVGRFTRLAGFGGMLVAFDEVVNLYKLPSGKSRRSNYEQILRMLNDSLQGTSEGIGFLFGGTPELLMDPRKGLYSYEALQTRLAANKFARDGLVDFSGPVITLANLSPEDLFVLLCKVRAIYSSGQESPVSLPDEGVEAFMRHCNDVVGEAYFRTPRNTLVSFVQLLAVLDQNPGLGWERLVGQSSIERETGNSALGLSESDSGDDDEFATFKL